MDILKKAALKTGLEKEKVNSIFSLGLAALIMSFLSSCAKNASSAKPQTDTSVKPAEKPLTPADVILDSSTVLDKKSCGPTPNYPCGTRYYSVSLKDFKVS
ncbi:MAG: hypothetical protein GX447_09150 [Elusimicrobia bacterium]|nr:hypothetical protein [Elusimicrobiota bacterium]